jgi:hypothetical protein
MSDQGNSVLTVKQLTEAILQVPEFMIFGAWDYRRCIFCRGPRKEHKKNCIRARLEEGAK